MAKSGIFNKVGSPLSAKAHFSKVFAATKRLPIDAHLEFIIEMPAHVQIRAEDYFTVIRNTLYEAFKGFVKDRLVPELRKQFSDRKNMAADYSPIYWISEEGGGIRHPGAFTPAADFIKGLDELEGHLIKYEVLPIEGGTLYAGIGDAPSMLSMKLSDYIPKSGRIPSAYNSFFYAVEFGTGIADNVGAGYVNTGEEGTGSTKIDKPVGAWTVGGTVTTGQRGFHFLYDKGSRLPAQIWHKIAMEELPERLRKAVKDVNRGSGG